MLLGEYIQKFTKQHLIFDFDGTLFYLNLQWERYFEAIQSELTVIDFHLWTKWTRGEYQLDELQNEYVNKYGDRVLSLFTEKNKHTETQLFLNATPNDTLVHFIEHNPQYIYSIWSSNTREVVEHVLNQHNLLSCFQTIVTRTEVRLLKPEADGYYLINPTKENNKAYVLIGNSSFDQGAAQAAGIDFMHVEDLD